MNHLKEQKDETLVDLTLLGNDAAYEELVIRYGKLEFGCVPHHGE